MTEKLKLYLVMTLYLFGGVPTLVAAAENETPKVRWAMDVCPAADYFVQDAWVFKTIWEIHGYDVSDYRQYGISLYPDVTLGGYVDSLENHDAAGLHIATECSKVGVMTFETYPHTVEGRDKRDSLAIEYSINAFPGDTIVSGSYYGNFYWIGFGGRSVNWIDDQNTFVCAACCSSGLWLDVWDTREAVGFPKETWSPHAEQQCAIFYGGLNGAYGPEYRNVGAAATQVELLHVGNGNTTLSPIVIDIDPPENSTLTESEYDLVISFDTKINTDDYDADYALIPSSGIEVSGMCPRSRGNW